MALSVPCIWPMLALSLSGSSRMYTLEYPVTLVRWLLLVGPFLLSPWIWNYLMYFTSGNDSSKFPQNYPLMSKTGKLTRERRNTGCYQVAVTQDECMITWKCSSVVDPIASGNTPSKHLEVYFHALPSKGALRWGLHQITERDNKIVLPSEPCYFC